jgi:hypothetical protein
MKKIDRNLSKRRNYASGLCWCGSRRSKQFKSCSPCRRKRAEFTRLQRATPEGMAKTLAYNRVGYRRLKELLFQIYGPDCRCCGEDKREFLTIDHIRPVGSKRTKNRCGVGFFRWLKKMKFPKGYRVLCLNCNFSIGHFGYCPHRKGAAWVKGLIGRGNSSRRWLSFLSEIKRTKASSFRWKNLKRRNGQRCVMRLR